MFRRQCGTLCANCTRNAWDFLPTRPPDALSFRFLIPRNPLGREFQSGSWTEKTVRFTASLHTRRSEPQAAYGNSSEAPNLAEEALKLAPASQGVESEAALAFAMAGETARAEPLVQDLRKRFPLDTQMQSLWLPAIRAQLALNRKSPALAVDHLEHTLPPIEYGQIGFVANLSCLYPTYVRGEAYLAVRKGTAAAAEFQKIIDHSSIVWNCWTGALAHLELARSNALQAKTSRGVDANAAAPGAGHR
jgi:tetratricopeptide (TPR) repeat protein